MPEPAPRRAVIGVGANLGDRWAALSRALETLAATPGIAGVVRSGVYETAPVGPVAQPDFLNLVAGVDTTLTPEQLLAVLQECERAAGRNRGRNAVRWGPRPLDLDLLLYEGETRDGPSLTLPHPRMWERAFVAVPLRELLADRAHWAGAEWDAARQRLRSAPAAPGVRRWEQSGRSDGPSE